MDIDKAIDITDVGWVMELFVVVVCMFANREMFCCCCLCQLTANTRVALRNDRYTIHKILPTKVSGVRTRVMA